MYLLEDLTGGNVLKDYKNNYETLKVITDLLKEAEVNKDSSRLQDAYNLVEVHKKFPIETYTDYAARHNISPSTKVTAALDHLANEVTTYIRETPKKEIKQPILSEYYQLAKDIIFGNYLS